MLTVQNAEHKIGKITCTENNNHRPITHKSYMHVTGIKQVILRSAEKSTVCVLTGANMTRYH